MCPAFIAPIKPNFVLSLVLSISSCETLVNNRVINFPFAESVFISSTAQAIFFLHYLFFPSKILINSQQLPKCISLNELSFSTI